MKRFIETWHDPIVFWLVGFCSLFLSFSYLGVCFVSGFSNICVYCSPNPVCYIFIMFLCSFNAFSLSLPVALASIQCAISRFERFFSPYSQILKHFQNLIALWIRYFSACQTETTTKHINNAKQVPSVPRTEYTLDKIQKPFWRSCS